MYQFKAGPAWIAICRTIDSVVPFSTVRITGIRRKTGTAPKEDSPVTMAIRINAE